MVVPMNQTWKAKNSVQTSSLCALKGHKNNIPTHNQYLSQVG